MERAWIVAAQRTGVAVRRGHFKAIEPWALGAEVIKSLLSDIRMPEDVVAEIILGNALYAGGNPARMAGLAAGLAEHIPALTIDTQCCSGLDAIAMARSRILAGDVDLVVTGGIESYSRAPGRFSAPPNGHEVGAFYARPPFAPWPDRDPDLIEANARLAAELGLSRAAQEAFAVASHGKALRAGISDREIVTVGDLAGDAYTRRLSAQVCARAPVIAGPLETGLTAATIAVEADAAAVLVMCSERVVKRLAGRFSPIAVSAAAAQGCAPERPAQGAIAATQALLERRSMSPGAVAVWEIMEAFAVQAQIFVDEYAIAEDAFNRGGGALARGHPIGASGAILAVRLFHELQKESAGAKGVAAIAAAGGLGSALLMERA